MSNIFFICCRISLLKFQIKTIKKHVIKYFCLLLILNKNIINKITQINNDWKCVSTRTNHNHLPGGTSALDHGSLVTTTTNHPSLQQPSPTTTTNTTTTTITTMAQSTLRPL